MGEKTFLENVNEDVKNLQNRENQLQLQIQQTSASLEALKDKEAENRGMLLALKGVIDFIGSENAKTPVEKKIDNQHVEK